VTVRPDQDGQSRSAAPGLGLGFADVTGHHVEVRPVGTQRGVMEHGIGVSGRNDQDVPAAAQDAVQRDGVPAAADPDVGRALPDSRLIAEAIRAGPTGR
jgi:hypothetical protein